MKNRRKNNIFLAMYLKWPLIVAGLVILMDIMALAASSKIRGVLLVFSVIIFATAVALYLISRRRIYSSLIGFSNAYNESEKRILNDLPYPVSVCDREGAILWENRAFKKLLKSEKASANSILAVFPDVSKDILQKLDETGLIHSSFGSKRYIATMRPDIIETEDGEVKEIVAFFIQDETELLNYKNAYIDSKLCEGLICIDNYDETMTSVEDVRQSLLAALVDRRISSYIDSMNGIVKRLEKDKYFFCVMDKDLNRMIDDKFSIIEEVKTINIGNEAALTISIGVGRDGESYAENYAFANGAMELALGRGGDQAVVKSGEDVSFFGGKSSAKEKNARVRARVKAQAFRDLIDSSEKLLVMGHRIGDNDSFGASVGFWRIAYSLGKKAYIILDKPEESFEDIYFQFSEENGYPKDMFISADEAMDIVDRDTIVAIVDTNRPDYTYAPAILDSASKKVLVDHHRMGADSLENPALSYIEPYASSASELVAEIVQYIGEGVKLRPLEAEALYAGIVIDTQNFKVQTGARTFEAAAFLKRMGADIVKIRKILRDDISDYKAQADSINNAEVYRDSFAISTLSSDGLKMPTVVCAQSANSLLEINHIRAAFVLTEYNGQVYISARSIDDINVQLLMEKLGGGGHKTVAGAQLKDITINEAKNQIISLIDEMLEEGEIE